MLKYLLSKGLLHGDCLTVTGDSLICCIINVLALHPLVLKHILAAWYVTRRLFETYAKRRTVFCFFSFLLNNSGADAPLNNKKGFL